MEIVKIYPIKSLMSHKKLIAKESERLIEQIKEKLNGYRFEYITDIKEAKSDDFIIILVQSGGSEDHFKNVVFASYDGPYYLLTYGSSNSLAASLEILSFIRQNNAKGEVLHGNIDYIVNRITTLYGQNKDANVSRLGVLGKPSDWLISSDVSYEKCKKVFNIELVDINQDVVVRYINDAVIDKKYLDGQFRYDENELSKALKIYQGIKDIINDYKLDGITIRCFDILGIFKSSSCLGLAILNKDDVIASCEGDIPSMISAKIVYDLLHLHAFQANPQWIEPTKNEIYFAHCTLPLDMANDIVLDTHFESKIGVGIHGVMNKGDVTIFKISNDLNMFYVEEGKLTKNEYRKDRCRTQIKIKLKGDVSYFLKSSLGNHHMIIYGKHKDEIASYLESFGLRRVTM